MRGRHLCAIDRDRKCVHGGSDSVMPARDAETEGRGTREEEDDQNQAHNSAPPRQRPGVEQGRQAINAAQLRPRRMSYLTSCGTTKEPIARSTTMVPPTTASRTRSLVKYGTRSRGIEGSPDCTTIRPRGPLTIVLRAPRDSSTARTVAWSPPTRACETERVGIGVPTAPGVAVPPTRTGWRYLALRPFLRPFLLMGSRVYRRLNPPTRHASRADLPTSGEALRLNSKQAGGWGSHFRSVGCDLWV